MNFGRAFENPSVLAHDAVIDLLVRALSRGSTEADEVRAARAMVGAALGDDDRTFIERCCLEVAERAEPGCQLLGLAGLCLGHAARRFGMLSDGALALAESLARRAERDSADVDGRALDGLADIRHFLPQTNSSS